MEIFIAAVGVLLTGLGIYLAYFEFFKKRPKAKIISTSTLAKKYILMLVSGQPPLYGTVCDLNVLVLNSSTSNDLWIKSLSLVDEDNNVLVSSDHLDFKLEPQQSNMFTVDMRPLLDVIDQPGSLGMLCCGRLKVATSTKASSADMRINTALESEVIECVRLAQQIRRDIRQNL